ncbi:uncharacterized protein LOC123505830 isoform X2 [Portunus trituberculatus]|uniref:uncharacterized protein LOC123505830 isoform X2 n=1 Tax=Portunus trituberculatus TaxID=210409 RepID=UPI001E1CD144|nr:uncharacterized protein LOC123505830 isoform X2 [Portunus trituberculatus]
MQSCRSADLSSARPACYFCTSQALLFTPVMSLEAKNWPFVGVWTPKGVTEDMPRLPGLDTSSLQADETKQNNQETKTLDDLLSPLSTLGVHALFPLMLAFTLYLGLVLWASSTLHKEDYQLYQTISELNAKTDQISEGLAALAQMYIDNYPFAYRSNPRSQDHHLQNPS